MGIYCPVQSGERLFQGELVERILEWVPEYDPANPLEVAGAKGNRHNLAVVLSQDCNLESDWRDRQTQPAIETHLPSVLLSPIRSADELRTAHNLIRARWEVARHNKDERYFYLSEVGVAFDSVGEGMGSMMLDMMSYFTIRTVEIYRQLLTTGPDAPRRRSRLKTPWAEHLQQRFMGYQARIGLSQDHFVPESRKPQPQLPPPPPPRS
jgi:hypothetical protein